MNDGSMHEHWMASRIMQNIASWAFDEEFRLFFTDSAAACSSQTARAM